MTTKTSRKINQKEKPQLKGSGPGWISALAESPQGGASLPPSAWSLENNMVVKKTKNNKAACCWFVVCFVVDGIFCLFVINGLCQQP